MAPQDFGFFSHDLLIGNRFGGTIAAFDVVSGKFLGNLLDANNAPIAIDGRTIPLLLFAAGARRIPMSTLGLLQYLTPSLQLLLRVWIYDEPFSGRVLLGYAVIWSALALYSLEGLLRVWLVRTARPAMDT